ncbi:hypothetical protein Pfo_009776 [Paulownia fortunei]|nr:hypothetical protein Pfo_009776 [Paulownia fortunei]
MSRFVSLSRAAVRRLSVASSPGFLLHQFTRHPLFPQSPTPLPLPQQYPSTRHFYFPSRKHFCSSAAVRISSTNPQAIPISLASFFCCQFMLFSNLSKSLASGAKHLEDIVIILLQIKHLLQKRFSQQCMQVLFLMCGTVVSLIFPVVQAIINAVEEALADSTTICRLTIIAGGLVADIAHIIINKNTEDSTTSLRPAKVLISIQSLGKSAVLARYTLDAVSVRPQNSLNNTRRFFKSRDSNYTWKYKCTMKRRKKV